MAYIRFLVFIGIKSPKLSLPNFPLGTCNKMSGNVLIFSLVTFLFLTNKLKSLSKSVELLIAFTKLLKLLLLC